MAAMMVLRPLRGRPLAFPSVVNCPQYKSYTFVKGKDAIGERTLRTLVTGKPSHDLSI
jgi:hypothetical protein